MEMSGEPALGYEIGLHSSLTSHGLMGYGLISSSTLRQAIALGESFLPLRLPMLSMTLAIDGRPPRSRSSRPLRSARSGSA